MRALPGKGSRNKGKKSPKPTDHVGISSSSGRFPEVRTLATVRVSMNSGVLLGWSEPELLGDWTHEECKG